MKKDNVDELLFEVIIQACSERDRTITHKMLSAYEDACEYLVKKGYLIKVRYGHYRINEKRLKSGDN